MVPGGAVTQYPSALWRSCCEVICVLKHQVSVRSSIFLKGFVFFLHLLFPPGLWGELKFRLVLANLMGLFFEKRCLALTLSLHSAVSLAMYFKSYYLAHFVQKHHCFLLVALISISNTQIWCFYSAKVLHFRISPHTRTPSKLLNKDFSNSATYLK